MLSSQGIIGLGLFAIFMATRVNRRNLIPLFIILLATFHYPTAFFLPGQILLGYVLNVGRAAAEPLAVPRLEAP